MKQCKGQSYGLVENCVEAPVEESSFCDECASLFEEEKEEFLKRLRS